jgi:hypothetical protein
MSDIYQKIMDATARRMDAAAILLTNELKEVLSVPVPRLVNKNVSLPSTGPVVKQRRTFVKDGNGLRLVNRGKLVTVTHKGKSDTFTVPWKDFTTYHTAAGKPVLVKRATPGAPPRKFEGRLRAGHTWERRDFIDQSGQGAAFSVTGPRSSGSLMVRRVGTNVKYAPGLEQGTHPYFTLTLMRVRPRLEHLMGGP